MSSCRLKPGPLSGLLRLFSLSAIIVMASSCADLEAPVRELRAENWAKANSPRIDPAWGLTAPGTVEILVVDSAPGKGLFGHAAIHIGRYAYSWDYGGGYVLVRQDFKSFLYRYTNKHNRTVTGITIEYPEDAVRRLKRNLDEEFRRAWSEDYKRHSVFYLNNCSTIAFRELVEAANQDTKSWPPVLLPVWMGRNVQRSFPLLYYTIYRDANR